MDLDYIKKGEQQYDCSTFKIGEPVEAVYRDNGIEIDRTNPYISALPLPRKGKELVKAARYIPPELISHAPTTPDEISLIKLIRLPLKFQSSLEDAFYMAMITSYRQRGIFMNKNISIYYTAGGEEQQSHQKISGTAGDATTGGFHMLGFSGCGKSSAIKTLTSHCPQYIAHKCADGTFPQITYLVVSCQPNDNLKALYANIGRAIDLALGNIVPIYENIILRGKSNGDRENAVAKLIDIFAIGIIIIDEIQLMSFNNTKANTKAGSFGSLMTLANKTKVAIAVVGTEDAYGKMFVNLQGSRRVGTRIPADDYCNNRKDFERNVRQILKYNLFGDPVAITKEFLDQFFKSTNGIIDQLMSILMYMVLDYNQAIEKPEINAEFIRETVNRHFPDLDRVLAELANPLNSKDRAEIIRQANEDFDMHAERMKAAIFAAAIDEDLESEETIMEDKIQNLIRVFSVVSPDSDLEKVKTIAAKVLKDMGATDVNDADLYDEVTKRIESERSSAKAKKKKQSAKSRKSKSEAKKQTHEANVEMLMNSKIDATNL